MKIIILIPFIILSNCLFSQASFKGKIIDFKTKEPLINDSLMVILENDTSYVKPDENGNFNFKTQPGRIKIVVLAKGYLSEINSMNVENGSMNTLSFSMINEKAPTSMDSIVYYRTASSVSSFGEDSVMVYPMDKMMYDVIPSTEGLEEKDLDLGWYNKTRESFGVKSTVGEVVVESVVESVVEYGDIENSRKPEMVEKPKKAEVLPNVLTAGEVNDFAKWGLWNDLSKTDFYFFSDHWKIDLKNRFCIQLGLSSGMPVIDAQVSLIDNLGNLIWEARTDNTGKAELWKLNNDNIESKSFSIKVQVGDFNQTFKNIHDFNKGINSFVIKVPCTVSDQLDIAFVVDATGSMGDEIDYLKSDLSNVISLIVKDNTSLNFNINS